MTRDLLTFYALSALALIGLVAWRPLVGVCALVLAVPLAGLGRGTVVPLLRVNEVVALLVVAGVLLHQLPRRQRRPISGTDLAVGSFVGGSILIPWMVLFLSHEAVDLDRWRIVLGPAQYLALYLIFSRAQLSERDLRLILNVAMGTSVIIGLVAIAEMADVPGVRDLVHTFYSPAPGSTPADAVYRPTSFLEHFSAVGAFALLNFSLALSLATFRHPAFSGKWLTLVVTINAAAVLASQTYATALGLGVAAIAIVWYGRRVPRQLSATAAALLLGLLVFSAQLSARLEQQFPASGAGLTPESLQTRVDYWREFFIPALAEHIQWGTGTVIPTEVPDRLTAFVDNEYLQQGFRAGVPGILLLFGILIVIGFAARRSRTHPDLWLRALGGTSLAAVLTFALIGTTAQYLTFAGVAQQFWMIVGLLSGRTWELERTAALGASSMPLSRTAAPTRRQLPA